MKCTHCVERREDAGAPWPGESPGHERRGVSPKLQPKSDVQIVLGAAQVCAQEEKLELGCEQ